MTRYRAAVTGCGPRSHGHLSAYRLLDTVEAVACCDLPFDPPEDLFQQLTAHLTQDHERTLPPTP